MSTVGNGGKGESVWVGWILINTLTDFSPFCRSRGEAVRETKYLKHIEDLKTALEKNAGTAIGFAAPISTTARRSVRLKMKIAGSIRSPSPGASSPGRNAKNRAVHSAQPAGV